MAVSRVDAWLGLGRVHGWVSGGCMPVFREGACLGLGKMHAWVSGGCMPGSREGAWLVLDRCMYTEKNKEKKKVNKLQNSTLHLS